MTQVTLANSGARTADWLAHQTGNGALYAYDVNYNMAGQAESLVRRAAVITAQVHRRALKELDKH